MAAKKSAAKENSPKGKPGTFNRFISKQSIKAKAEGKKSPSSTELSPLWMAMSAEEKKEASA